MTFVTGSGAGDRSFCPFLVVIGAGNLKRCPARCRAKIGDSYDYVIGSGSLPHARYELDHPTPIQDRNPLILFMKTTRKLKLDNDGHRTTPFPPNSFHDRTPAGVGFFRLWLFIRGWYTQK